ncbi:MAG TPA: hypothetical protein VD999_00990 [Vitreimonas sp.]|nr:hypothetical protein [Vitreimonas sp.]
MLKLLVLFSFLIALGLGIATVFGWQAAKYAWSSHVPFTPTTPTFQLVPPAHSLTAQLTTLTGEPLKEPRDTTDKLPVTLNETLLEGETLFTDATSSATVHFPQFATIALDANSQIVLSDAQPEHFLITHRDGLIKYQAHHPSQTLSIRASSVLIALTSGEAALAIDHTRRTVTLQLLTGTAKLAIIGADNQTRTWNINAGQTAVVNTATTQVTLN